MRSAIIACLLLAAAPFAMADGHNADPEVVQEYRSGIYRSIGGHMTAIVQIVRHGYRIEDVGHHAGSMAALAKITPHIFPEGSGGGDSEALPEIWEQPDEFSQRVQDFIEAADGMVTAAATGDRAQIGGGLQNLGRTCKGCHDNFRAD